MTKKPAKFCTMLNEMLEDEEKASGEYEQLADLTKSKPLKKLISQIERQEKNHKKILLKIQTKICKSDKVN